MKCILVLLVWTVSAISTDVTPVQKVIKLLNGMLVKGKVEKHSEEEQYASQKQFCDDTSVGKTRSIKKADESINMLTADISKYTADSAELGKDVAKLDKDVSDWEGDINAATKVREAEKTDYAATHKDYTMAEDALTRAIAVVKHKSADKKQTGVFSQVAALKKLNLIPVAAKRSIDTFLSTVETTEDLIGQPQAAAYQFQSHGIVELLEKLYDKFLEEKSTLEKEESNAKHAFDMLVQDLKAQSTQATTDRGEKAQAKSSALHSKADAKGDLQDVSATRAEDSKYLASLTSECRTKAADFESRQQLRVGEIQAIEKAIELLSSGAFLQAAKHLRSLLQKKTAFPQLRANSLSPAQEKATFYLQEQAKHLHSRVLSAMASRVQADPFNKVKKMIKDMIVRLIESANEEASHKEWCDAELATNEQTRKEKTEATELLHAEIDELKANIAQNSEDIADLNKAVAELSTAIAEATKMRAEEKASNSETLSDAQDAQTAVAQALVVLKEFYAQAAGAAAFAQTGQSPFTGQDTTGVVGMLEVVEADFARLEAETSAAEASAQKNYDIFMTESDVDKAAKTKAGEHKSSKQQNQKQELTQKGSDLEGTQKELDTALSYYEKLKPSCVDAGTSYDDRVSRRQEEIESLQEGLKILNGEDVA